MYPASSRALACFDNTESDISSCVRRKEYSASSTGVSKAQSCSRAGAWMTGSSPLVATLAMQDHAATPASTAARDSARKSTVRY